MGELLTLPPVPESFAGQYHRVAHFNWVGWLDKRLHFPASRPWFEHPRDLLENHAVQWFKRGRNLLAEVRWPVHEDGDPAPSVEPIGATVVLKGYGAANLYERLCEMVQPPRAIRAWERAFALIECGINTPRPLCLMLTSNQHGGVLSYLAVETAPSHFRLRDILKRIRRGADALKFGDGDHLDTKTFLSILGCYVRAMHDAGVWHRDFSGGNLLIPKTWRPSPSLCESVCTACEAWILIDVDRARLDAAPGGLSAACRIQDLERIAIPPAAREILYDAYSAGHVDLENAKGTYLRHAELYRRLRETRNPIARVWRKVFTYRLRLL